MSFCGILNKEIVVSSCPLMDGACMWKHRKTGLCAYTSDELSTEAFCERVGIEVPTPQAIIDLRNAIIAATKN